MCRLRSLVLATVLDTISTISPWGAHGKGEYRDEHLPADNHAWPPTAAQDAELARTTAVDMATTTDSELHVVTVAPRYPSVDVNVPQGCSSNSTPSRESSQGAGEKIQQAGGKVAQTL